MSGNVFGNLDAFVYSSKLEIDRGLSKPSLLKQYALHFEVFDFLGHGKRQGCVVGPHRDRQQGSFARLLILNLRRGENDELRSGAKMNGDQFKVKMLSGLSSLSGYHHLAD